VYTMAAGKRIRGFAGRTNGGKSIVPRLFAALILVLVGIAGLALIPLGYACVGFSGNRAFWWMSVLGAAVDILVIHLAVRLNKVI